MVAATMLRLWPLYDESSRLSLFNAVYSFVTRVDLVRGVAVCSIKLITGLVLPYELQYTVWLLLDILMVIFFQETRPLPVEKGLSCSVLCRVELWRDFDGHQLPNH